MNACTLMIVGDVTEEMISWIGCDECCKLENESEMFKPMKMDYYEY